MLGGELAAARIRALTEVHNKKVRALMGTIQLLEKRIKDAEIQNKENKRSNLIKLLEQDLKDQEVTIAILRRELVNSARLNDEKVDELIARAHGYAYDRVRIPHRERLQKELKQLQAKATQAQHEAMEAKARVAIVAAEKASVPSPDADTRITYREHQKTVARMEDLARQVEELQAEAAARAAAEKKLTELNTELAADLRRLRAAEEEWAKWAQEREKLESRVNELRWESAALFAERTRAEEAARAAQREAEAARREVETALARQAELQAAAAKQAAAAAAPQTPAAPAPQPPATPSGVAASASGRASASSVLPELAAARNEAAALQSKLREAESQLAARETALTAKWQEAVAAAQEERNRAADERARLEGRLEAVEKEASALRAQVADLRIALAAAQRERDLAAASASAPGQPPSGSSGVPAEALATLEATVAQLRKQLGESAAAAGRAREREAQLAADADALRQQLAAAQQQLRAAAPGAAPAVTRSTAEVDALRQREREQAAAEQELRKTLATARAKAEAAERAAEEARGREAALQERAARAEDRAAALERLHGPFSAQTDGSQRTRPSGARHYDEEERPDGWQQQAATPVQAGGSVRRGRAYTAGSYAEEEPQSARRGRAGGFASSGAPPSSARLRRRAGLGPRGVAPRERQRRRPLGAPALSARLDAAAARRLGRRVLASGSWAPGAQAGGWAAQEPYAHSGSQGRPPAAPSAQYGAGQYPAGSASGPYSARRGHPEGDGLRASGPPSARLPAPDSARKAFAPGPDPREAAPPAREQPPPPPRPLEPGFLDDTWGDEGAHYSTGYGL
eukprot:tig00000849_g4773.t1